MKKEMRQSNFELMRIVSMFMIVIWHIIIHGHVIENCQRESLKIIFNVIEFIIVIHVNSFVMCTGYFQSKSKFKMSSVLKNINSCWFYNVILMIVFVVFNIKEYSHINIIQNIFSFGLGSYWFMNNYIILYCLSPFLNKLVSGFNEKNFRKLIIALFILFSIMPFATNLRFLHNDGYTLYNFIFLYFLGAYFAKYPLKETNILKNTSKSLLQMILLFSFILCFVINFCTTYVAQDISKYSNIFSMIGSTFITSSLSYSSPMIIIQTICYFCLFETLDIKSTFINRMSKLTLGVYLISDNRIVRGSIYNWLKIDNGVIVSYKFIFYVAAVAILIYISCSIIEWLRQVVFKFIYNRNICIKFRYSYRKWIDSLGIKIKW